MILLRRVTGKSMLPTLYPGTILVAWARPARYVPGDVIIFLHDGKEKIKRVQAVKGDRVFVVGDHQTFSTDSREFGWIDRSAIRAKVWWPRKPSGAYRKRRS